MWSIRRKDTEGVLKLMEGREEVGKLLETSEEEAGKLLKKWKKGWYIFGG